MSRRASKITSDKVVAALLMIVCSFIAAVLLSHDSMLKQLVADVSFIRGRLAPVKGFGIVTHNNTREPVRLTALEE